MSRDVSWRASAATPHPAVWRAAQLEPPPARAVATGYPALAAHLPGRGWPYYSLIELLVPSAQSGVLTLLQPALAAVAGPAPIVLVRPPHVPQAAYWLDCLPARAVLWWVRPNSQADTLWAIEQSVRSAACAAVLAWLPQVPVPALRRLQLAAQLSSTLLVVVRPWSAHKHSSPAPLRLGLQWRAAGLQVHFFKVRGVRPQAPVILPVWPERERSRPEPAPASALSADVPPVVQPAES